MRLEESLKGHISPQVPFSDPNTKRMKQSFVKDFTSKKKKKTSLPDMDLFFLNGIG